MARPESPGIAGKIRQKMPSLITWVIVWLLIFGPVAIYTWAVWPDTPSTRVTCGTVVGDVAVDSQANMAASPGGRSVYVAFDAYDAQISTEALGMVGVIDTSTDEVSATIQVGRYPRHLAVSPDGRRLYAAHPGSLSVIDTETRAVIGKPIDLDYGLSESDLRAMAISLDGRNLYVTAASSDNALSVVDTATGAVSRPFDIGHGLDGLAVSPDGRRVYATYPASYPDQLDLPSDSPPDPDLLVVLDPSKATYPCDDIPIGLGSGGLGMAVSPDGRRVYVARPRSVSVIEVIDPPRITDGPPS